MTSVTVLGMGPMGRAVANAFLDGGHPTTVWNRTPGKADALVARGAAEATSVAEAVAASSLVLAVVLDYDAVHGIVGQAIPELKGRTLVNLTADSPARAREMAGWAAENGIEYLDGAIMSPSDTIGGPAAVVLYSGPEDVYQGHQPVLAALGGTGAYLGADPGRAAGYDVALLDLFWTSMSGIAHAFAVARAEGISGADLAQYAQGIGQLLPGVIDEFAVHVDEGRYPGDEATIGSAAASLEHIIHVADSHGLDTGVLTAANAVAQRAIDGGHGGDNYSRLTETLTRT